VKTTYFLRQTDTQSARGKERMRQHRGALQKWAGWNLRRAGEELRDNQRSDMEKGNLADTPNRRVKLFSRSEMAIKTRERRAKEAPLVVDGIDGRLVRGRWSSEPHSRGSEEEKSGGRRSRGYVEWGGKLV